MMLSAGKQSIALLLSRLCRQLPVLHKAMITTVDCPICRAPDIEGLIQFWCYIKQWHLFSFFQFQRNWYVCYFKYIVVPTPFSRIHAT